MSRRLNSVRSIVLLSWRDTIRVIGGKGSPCLFKLPISNLVGSLKQGAHRELNVLTGLVFADPLASGKNIPHTIRPGHYNDTYR
jgi:hypothetical protein